MKTWFHLLRRAGAIAPTYLAFLAAAWAFLRQVEQEPTFGYIAGVASAGLLWSYLLACLWERRPSSTLDLSGAPYRVYRFRGRARYALSVGAVVVPAASLLFLYSRTAREPQPDEVLVLVAEFDGPDQVFGVTESIFEELRALEKADPHLRVRSAGLKITPQNGPATAERIARERGAAVIVWGWYRATSHGVSLNAHYQVVEDSCASYFGPSTRRVVADIRDLSCFVVQTQVASEMAVLARITAGLAHYSRKRDQEATGYFRSAFRASAQSPSLLDQRTRARLAHLAAHASWMVGQLDSANLYYDSAIVLNPSYWRSYVGRGGVRADQRDFATAIRFLDRAVAISSNNPEALGSRGEVHRRAGNYLLAGRDLDAAVQLRPGLWWLYNERGKLAAAMGNQRSAETDFTRALALADKDVICRSQLYNERGSARFALYERDPANNRHMLAAAAADFSAALRILPSYTFARYNRGVAYSRLGYVRRAYADYSKRIELDPGDYQTRVARGRLLIEKLGKPTQAIEDFEAAIVVDPDRPDAYYLRGMALAQTGATSRAIQDFRRVHQVGRDTEWSAGAAAWISRLTLSR